MTHSNRRDFLRRLAAASAAGTTLAALPPVLQKALAIPANRRSRSIRDVEHVVTLFCFENLQHCMKTIFCWWSVEL